ncbi:MAG: hypothetical protein ABIQ57_17985 [Candidatus Kapaibacterium sp.]
MNRSRSIRFLMMLLALTSIALGIVLPSRLFAQGARGLGDEIPIPMHEDVVRKTSDTFDFHNILDSTSKNLIIHGDPAPYYCCDTKIGKAKLYVDLRMGLASYGYDTLPFNYVVNLRIEEIDSTGSVIGTITPSLTIYSDPTSRKYHPEQVYVYDFTSNYDQIDTIRVTAVGLAPTHSYAQQDSDLTLEAYTEEEWKTATTNPDTTAEMVSPDLDHDNILYNNPLTFRWTLNPNCNDHYPRYQFQVLRLFSNDPADTVSELTVHTVVDWSKALMIETDSPDTALTLTIAEGKGFYAWRVRPVGDRYPGGSANDRNWGKWSSAPTDGPLTLALIPLETYPGTFYYSQFDDSLNWIYSRTFTEGNEGVRIGERITYANGLTMPQQTQARIRSTDSLLLAETKYDYSGRAAFSTLAAPAEGRGFGFRSGFIDSVYTAADFDADTNWNNPKPITSGILHDYYSDTNPDIAIPDANGYPFTRTLFFTDGTSRPLETSGFGDSMRIKASGPHRTARAFYAAPSNSELISMFGDEAPDASSVQKTVSLDPNNVAMVSYISKEGEKLATCLSVDTSASTLEDTLNEPRLGSYVVDTLTKSFRFGENLVAKGTTVAFTQPTALTLHYVLTPKTIAADCGSYCARCDYKVLFVVTKTDGPQERELRDSVIVPGGSCEAGDPITYTTTIQVGPGSYSVVRLMYVNTIDTSTLNDSDRIGRHYLDRHMDSVRSQTRHMLDSSLATVFAKLDSVELDRPGALDNLNQYLQTKCGDPANGEFTFLAGCDSIKIPYRQCIDTIVCDTDHIEFEELLLNMWGPGGSQRYHDSLTDSTYTFSDSLSPYFGYDYDPSGTRTLRIPANSSAFPHGNGAFNRLIRNMIRDGYSCTGLWNCWRSLVVSYGQIATKDGSGDPRKLLPEFDLLDAFLTCTGKKLEGVTNQPFDSTSAPLGYVTYAHRYFKYRLCGVGNPPPCYCEDSVGLHPGTWTTSDHDSWDSLYHCVRSQNHRFPSYNDSIPSICIGTTIDTNCLHAQITQTENGCRSVCESRRGTYLAAILDAYHRRGLVVQGDRYLPDSLGNNPVTDSTHIDVTLWEVECKLSALIAECESGCTLSIHRTGGRIDSIGTSAEREAFARSMTQTFDVRLPNEDNSCDEGYTSIGGSSVSTAELIVWYLNQRLRIIARDSVGISGGYWNVKSVVREIDTAFAAHLTDSIVFVEFRDASGHFVLDSCRLLFVADTSICGLPSAPHELVDSLNSFLDREWGYRLTGVTPVNSCSFTSGADTIETRNYSYTALPSAYRAIRTNLESHLFSCINGVDTAARLDRYLRLDSIVLAGGSPFVHDFRTNTDSLYRIGAVSVTTPRDTLYLALKSSCFSSFAAAGSTPPPVTDSVTATNKIVGCGTRSLDTSGSETTANNENLLVSFIFGSPYTTGIGHFEEDAEGYLVYINNASYMYFAITPLPIVSDTTRFCSIRFAKSRSRLLAINICDTVACGPICFKWVKIDSTTSVGHVDTVRAITCQQHIASYIREVIRTRVYNAVERHADSIRLRYMRTCAFPDSVQDLFWLSYPINYYHFTLYYYDRAGNLVKTVPPLGVDLTKTSRSQHPNHTLITGYEYNSLKWLLRQRTPDGDTTRFLYDDKGQVRFAQSARQFAFTPKRYTYSKYDRLGRAIEAGEAMLDTGVNLLQKLSIPSFPRFDSTAITARTLTYYTTPAPIGYLGDTNRRQRYLLNRVSYSVSYTYNADTTDDSVASYFSYDPHGNVEWTMRYIPTFGSNYIRYEYDLYSGNMRLVAFNEKGYDQFYQRYSYDPDNRLQLVESSRDNVIWDRDARYHYYLHGPLRRVEMGEDSVQGMDYTYTLQGWLKAINVSRRGMGENPPPLGGDFSSTL